MTTVMSTSKSAARRAILQTSRVRWKTDQCEIVPIINSDTSKYLRCLLVRCCDAEWRFMQLAANGNFHYLLISFWQCC